MKININITNTDLSDIESPIDTYDGKTIFFDILNRLPNKLVFDVWGVSLNKNADWKSYGISESIIKDKFESDIDIAIIQGYGQFVINDIIACNLKIYPVTFIDQKNLKKDDRNVCFERAWNLDKIDDNCFKYFFDTNIYFPNGNCELEIYAKGNASFSFDSKNIVRYRNYLSQDEGKSFKGFLEDKSLGINQTKLL